MGMLIVVVPPPMSKASAPETRFNDPVPLNVIKTPGGPSEPLNIPPMLIALFTVTVNGVVTVVVPAQKPAASPETHAPGVAVCALVGANKALVVSHVPARFAAVGVAVPSGSHQMTADLALFARSAKESNNKQNGVLFMTLKWDEWRQYFTTRTSAGGSAGTGIHRFQPL
jgi:hypothetical protein